MPAIIHEIVNVLAPVLLAVILAIVTKSAPLIVELVVQFINSKLTEHQQSVLYAAVKVGVRAAAAQGFTPENAWNSAKAIAVEAALDYAKRFGLALDEQTLIPLIDAEAAKQELQRPVLSVVPEATDGV